MEMRSGIRFFFIKYFIFLFLGIRNRWDLGVNLFFCIIILILKYHSIRVFFSISVEKLDE